MGNCAGGKGKKDPKILTEEEIKLLLDNTNLNRAQIRGLHANFLKECPSGKLKKKDFVKLFKEVHPSNNKKEKANKFCDYVFKVIDRENQGYISFKDFVLCFSLTSNGDFKQKCDFAFKMYDLNKDDTITKKEMTRVLTALYDLSGITDRKGANAPKAKVDSIIKLININNPKQAVVEAPPPAPAPGKKAPKPKKKKKGNEDDYITKQQFVDAITNDESLRKLFYDSIFIPNNEENFRANLSLPAADVSVNTPDTNAVNDVIEDLNAATQSVIDDANAATNVSIEAPSVSVNVN